MAEDRKSLLFRTSPEHVATVLTAPMDRAAA